MIKIYKKILSLLETKQDFVVVEIIDSFGSTPRTTGALMVVSKDFVIGTIGGGGIEYIAVLDAKKCLKQKKSIKKRYNLNDDTKDEIKMICGGSSILKFTYIDTNGNPNEYINNLLQLLKNRNRCIIFGAGHVGKATSDILDYINFEVLVYDDRKELLEEHRYKENVKLIYAPFTEIEKHININENDFVVIMTSTHTNDYEVEKVILKTPAYYIGCIGSEHRHIITNKKLIEEDNFTNKDIERIKTPIGISIGAETPEEIAVSIVSEIILYLSKKENRKKFVENKTVWRKLND